MSMAVAVATSPENNLESESLPRLAVNTRFDDAVKIGELMKEDPVRAAELFDKGYKIYCEVFPDPSERESAEALKEYLADETTGFEMLLFLQGNEVVGGRHVNVRSVQVDSDSFSIGVDNHLYVAKSHQRMGLGSEIVAKANEYFEEKGCALIIAEQNDPYVMTEDEKTLDAQSGISTEGRLEFWKKQGYVAFDCPYAQPSLDGGEPVWYLRLSAKFLDPAALPDAVAFDGRSMSSEAVLNMMRSYHAAFVEDIDSDPTSYELKQQLGSRSTVALIGIDEERTFGSKRPDLAQN